MHDQSFLSIQKITATMLFKQTHREWVKMFGKANKLCTYTFYPAHTQVIRPQLTFDNFKSWNT